MIEHVDNSIERFETFLSKKIGFDPHTVGKNTVANALSERMNVCRIADFNEYYELLMSSAKEEQNLIEALIIPETWFFRGRESFNFLADYLRTEWPILGANKILRILSMPCSSGEEPYSIAMTLLDAGLKPRNYHIDALDISVGSLHKAKKGIYRENSFREPDINIRDKFFKKNEAGEYLLNPSVREHVHFFYGNLADPAFRCGSHRYNIIFCRNLLIYLTDVARKHIFHEIDTLLEEHGIIITSPAEFDLFLTWGYEPVKYPQACAFRKFIPKAAAGSEKIVEPAHVMQLSGRIPATAIAEEVTLEKISQSANSGHFEEAITLCEEYISHHQIDAKGYFFLGILQYIRGQDDLAMESLNKALYLDPEHYESLIYLSLLEEKKGKKQQADLLRQRAQKSFVKNHGTRGMIHGAS